MSELSEFLGSVNPVWVREAWQRRLSQFPPDPLPGWWTRFKIRAAVHGALDSGRGVVRHGCPSWPLGKPVLDGFLLSLCEGCKRTNILINRVHAADPGKVGLIHMLLCESCHPVAMEVYAEPKRRTKARKALERELRRRGRRPFVASAGREGLSREELAELDPEDAVQALRRPWSVRIRAWNPFRKEEGVL